MDKIINALFLGDVIGQPGSRALFVGLQGLVKKLNADVVIVNGENSAQGFGITPEIVRQFFSIGVHVITTGNHVWQKKEILPVLDSEEKVLRPANYPQGNPGHGYCLLDVAGEPVAVVNLQGRVRMTNLLCPFTTARSLINKIRKKASIIIVDFHAEATEEKEALALYLDGDVSAVLGTHTHIQTADERILPKGTAFLSDAGMIGPVDSVIGIQKEIAVRRSLTQIPIKMEVAENPSLIQGALVRINTRTAKAVEIVRISEKSAL